MDFSGQAHYVSSARSSSTTWTANFSSATKRPARRAQNHEPTFRQPACSLSINGSCAEPNDAVDSADPRDLHDALLLDLRSAYAQAPMLDIDG